MDMICALDFDRHIRYTKLLKLLCFATLSLQSGNGHDCLFQYKLHLCSIWRVFMLQVQLEQTAVVCVQSLQKRAEPKVENLLAR